jgi:thiosulfate dehydrogenase [quinone] large subunit
MIIKFLKENVYASIALTIIRVYVGWQWLHAGWGKVTADQAFDAKGFLMGAVAKSTGDHPSVQGWWATFLDNVAIPGSGVFSFLVSWGELLVGLGLILGCFTTFAALMGILMNFAFLLSGTTSTNTQLVILGILIVIGGYNAAKFGADRYVGPYLKGLFTKNNNKKDKNAPLITKHA